MRVELREFERGHEFEPASLVLGVPGGKELHGAALIHLVDQDALVTRVLDDLRRARKAKEPLHAVEFQGRCHEKSIVVALQHAIESIRNREVDAGRTQSTPQLWVGPKIEPKLEALRERLSR